jgi:NAD dependent epimerase/dehydratase family enzyme
MIERFKRFGPGILGTGRQWFSWIHVEDLARIFTFVLANREMTGPFNCVAPGAVTNRHLTEAIAERLGKSRPRISVPAFALKLLMGEFAEVVLNGQRAHPTGLLAKGFTFKFEDIEAALGDLIDR